MVVFIGSPVNRSASSERVDEGAGEWLGKVGNCHNRSISAMTRHKGFLVFPGFNLLDLSGPLEVFQWAERHNPGAYQLTVMSLNGAVVESESPLTINANPLVQEPLDTLLVPRAVGTPSRPAISAGTLVFLSM